jgi:4-hydroxyphenylpyruvate dioxygenase
MGGTLPAKLGAAAAAGFDGIELTDADLAASGLSPAEAARMAAGLGLQVLLYQPLRDVEGTPPGRLREGLDRAKRMLDAARELGAGTLLACSSTAPDAIDDDGLAAAQLGQLADLAAARGIRIAFEALSWGTAISDYRRAWQVVQSADRPNLGIALDSFHVLARGHDPARIRGIPGERIFFVQLADAAGWSAYYRTWSRHRRRLPGDGRLDLAGFARCIAGAGYAGPWSLEVFSDGLAQEPPGDVAARAIKSLAELLDDSLLSPP